MKELNPSYMEIKPNEDVLNCGRDNKKVGKFLGKWNGGNWDRRLIQTLLIQHPDSPAPFSLAWPLP